MGERSNAVITEVADALGTPITRAEVQAVITDAVAAEWQAQQEAITDAAVDQLRDEFPNGLGAQRIDKDGTAVALCAQNAQDKAYGGPS